MKNNPKLNPEAKMEAFLLWIRNQSIGLQAEEYAEKQLRQILQNQTTCITLGKPCPHCKRKFLIPDTRQLILL